MFNCYCNILTTSFVKTAKPRLARIAVVSVILASLVTAIFPVKALAAGEMTTTGTLSLVPTIECIGVSADFTGDANQNNNAVLEYRASGTGSWKTAPQMYADRTRSQYRGSIFWLTTDTEYEVRVTYTDADGVSGSPVTGTVRTRNDNPPSNGNAYYVATTGSDNNTGTEAQPFRTIQKAANTVAAGGTVYIREGTYQERVTVKASGTSNNYITFRNYGSESVTLTGGVALANVLVINAKNYVRIKGLTMRSTTSNIILITGSSGIIIEDSTFIHDVTTIETGAIRLDYGTEKSLIQRNTFHITTPNISNAVFGVLLWRASGGHVFRNNTIDSANNALRDGWGGGPEDEVGYSQDNDLYNNTIIGARDDALQPDGGNVNVRVWNNRIENSLLGISACPTLLGPMYIFRNVIVNGTSGEFKLGNDTVGRIYSYHNTYYTTQAANGYFTTNSGLANMVSRNNIIHAGRYIIEFGHTGDIAGHDFDYDNLYTTDPGRFVKWVSTYGSFSSFRTATGQEPHGISVSDSKFTNPAGGDLTLQATSPCIDKGVVLPGFNDADSPWPYRGSSPDMGAYEYQSGAPPNSPPVLDPIGNKVVNEGQLLQFTVSATDPNGDNLTYSATGLPTGASFSPATRVFSWTPASGQAGTYSNVHFEVSDSRLTASENVTIVATPASDGTPPQISNVSSSNVRATAAYITWTTDELSTSQVEYSASPSKLTALDGSLVTNHLVNLTGLTPGTTYSYRVTSMDKAGNLAVRDGGTFTTSQSVFSVSALSISPERVYVGKKVTISVLVTNKGNTAGSHAVTLLINGVKEATKVVTLGAGTSQKVTFYTTKSSRGIYKVDVNGLTGTFEVRVARYHH